MEWQPIETAPRDGTRVLLSKVGSTEVVSGYWNGIRYEDIPVDEWLTAPGGWRRQPTHWMPLPEPPK